VLYAKISTDKTITFGPVLAADGTMSSGALAYTDAKIFKNGTDGALNASATFTHKYEGVYALLLKAADLDAVGCYEVVLNKNPLSASPVKITVLAANVYDWLFGTVAPTTATAAALATAIWQDATAGDFTVASSIGKALYVANIAPGAAGGHFIAGTNAATTVASWTCTAASTNGSTVLGNTTMGTLTQTGAVSWGATTFASIASSGTVTLNALAVTTTTTLSGAVSLGSTLGVTGAITATAANDIRGVKVGGILATALTETSAGYLAAGFKKLFDVATPVLTAASVNQTGDSYARIGAAGASLTAIPWNPTWDAEAESEVNDALVALNLDHLLKTATAAPDMTTEVADNTILARVLANGDTSAFDPSTDGLQPIRDAEVTPTDASKTGYKLASDGLDAIAKMKALLDSTETGTVNDASPAVSGFKTSLQPASAAFFDGAYLQFTGGTQLKQARLLDGCTLDGGYLVVAWAAGEDDLTAAPANADPFLIIGRSK